MFNFIAQIANYLRIFKTLYHWMKKQFSHWLGRVTRVVRAHKFKSAGAVLLIVLFVWWGASHAASVANARPRYVLTTVQKQTIVSSVSASGQISASTELQVKPKVSGDV